MQLYLDHAATTPVRREVLEAMWPYLTGEFGNPSSHHEMGRTASVAVADARATVARWLDCRPAEVVFTSGGTEGDNLALLGIARAMPRGRHVVISAIEHPAVSESADFLARHHGFEVSRVGVDSAGLVDPEEFARALRPETTIASVMLANNEMGAVQPVRELAALASERGIPFHTDAVQAAGWLDIAVSSLGVDALTMSGHKLGAPKGIGAVFLRSGLPIEPLIHGGGQERARRSGTENVAGIVGLATAIELAESDRLDRVERVTRTRDAFIDRVLATVPGAILTGPRTERLAGSASFCFPRTSGEAVLLRLEERGVTCSSGSACAAGSDDPSPVLLAMGIAPEVAQTAVRFTFGGEATDSQLEDVAGALAVAVAAVSSLA